MDLQQARLNMIEQQIRPWEVFDQKVLNLLNEMYREEFIPDAYQDLCFTDTRLPIGHEQTTMTPKIEARVLQSLTINPEDSVLEIGTGCGYLTVLLAKSAKHVRSIDIFPDFIDSVKAKIAKTELTNIELENCDAYSIFEQSAKYDVIVLTASLPTMDDRFLNLLNDGGRLFVIIGESPVMEACVFTRQSDSSWSQESIFETDLPALIGAEHKETFKF